MQSDRKTKSIFVMVTAVLICIVVIILIVVNNNRPTNDNSQANTNTEVTNDDVTQPDSFKIELWSFIQGGVQKVSILKDGSFTDDNALPINEKYCVQGKLTADELEQLKTVIKENDFFELEIPESEKSKENLMCEAGDNLTIALDGRVNAVSSICNDTPKESTELVLEKKNRIQDLIYRLIASAEKTECEKFSQ